MSNLETESPETVCEGAESFTDQVLDPREVPLGGVKGVTVSRTLPHRELPTIGAFCFVDHFGPTSGPGRIDPHPHTGLQTVTWLFDGRIRHRDSVGSDVLIEPGQLNLMSAGRGIAHSEYDQAPNQHGLQLWVAQPDESRFADPHFEQHSDLPAYELDAATATVAIGTSGGLTSPAKQYTPLLAVEIDLRAGASEIAVDPAHEHGFILANGSAKVDGSARSTGEMSYFAPGRESLVLEADEPVRGLLIGGEPLCEDIVMWWNFVGRSHEEIVTFREDWEAGDDHFGHVVGHGSERIPAPPMPQVQLKARRRR